MESKDKPKFAQLWPQWLASAEVCLVYIVMGSCIGWISPFLGHLSRPNPPFTVTKSQTTWIASLMYLTRSLGVILVSISINRFGSKITLWIGGVIFVVGYTFLIAADKIEIVFICLIFLGFAGGWCYPVVGIYIAEIAYAPIRGAIMALAIHGFMVGMLIGNLLGSLLSPWQFGVVNLILTIIFLIAFYFVPQTPYYFVNHKQLEAAEKSIRWYTRDVDATRDLERLITFLATSPRLSYMGTLREIFKPVNLKVLLMISIAFGCIEFCGILTIVEYSEIIFIKANVTVINPATLVTIMAAISIPACWISMVTIDRFGRTTTMLISCIMFAVAIGGFAVNFHLLDLGYDNPNIQWIVIIGASLFRISINTGLIPIRITLMAELYAPNIKSLCNSINSVTMSICVFISSKNFQFMTDHMTYKYTFYMYAGCILIFGIFIKIYIPETKGKTLEEIQAILKGKQSLNHIKNNQCNIKQNTANLDKNIPDICTHL